MTKALEDLLLVIQPHQIEDRGSFFDHNGTLDASVVQEAMIRPQGET